METMLARSWSELQEVLFSGSWDAGMQRHRSPCVFRGAPHAGCRLETALMRLGGDFAALEPHLIRNFAKYAHHAVGEQGSLWEWLSLAQHHGLPTRLLDWTYSPLVAMHFMTAEPACMGVDGCIWCVDHAQANRLLPGRLRDELSSEGANCVTTAMLARAVPSLAEFDALANSPFLVFLEPPSIDQRIVNQFALFSVLSDPRVALETHFEAHPDLCRRIVVPASAKWEIRDKLDQCNVTERVLLPGLDGLCRWLRRYYGPREIPPGVGSLPDLAADPSACTAEVFHQPGSDSGRR